MNRRSLVATVVVAGMFATGAAAADAQAPATASARWVRCGSIDTPGAGRLAVSRKGTVSCRGARKLMNLFLNEHQGTKHGGPYAYQTYWTLYGWQCGTGAGGGGCRRPGARASAEWVPR